MSDFNLLNEDVEKFNLGIYSEIKSKLKETTSIYKIIDICKESNKEANDIYFKKYNTHKDLVNIIERAVSIIESCFINEYKPVLVENMLDDIEFVIGQNVLTESHIKRLLLSPVTLQQMPIFSIKTENIKSRLNDLYNMKNMRYDCCYESFKAEMPFNYQQVKSYLKYHKVGFEEELVGNDINGDYKRKTPNIAICKESVIAIDEPVVDMYKNIEPINIIDMFKLQEHGFEPIIAKHYDGKDYFVHFIHDSYYNLYKSKICENTYYMFTLLPNSSVKSYKITINEKPEIDKITSNAMIESTFITDKNIIKKVRR
jgi:hypothetical protein